MPNLLVLMGLPGTGKSTVIQAFLERHPHYLWLDTDRIRRIVLEDYFDEQGIPDPVIYQERMKNLIYRVLFLLTRYLLICGKNVILEGVFGRNELRLKIFNLAKKLNCQVTFVELIISDVLARKRLRERMKVSPDLRVSDADYSVYLSLKQKYEDPSEEIKEAYHVLDAGEDINKIVGKIEDILGETSS